MKNKLTFWIIIIVAFLAGGFLWLNTNNHLRTPKKFVNIPKEATWIGGVDEGFWYQIVSIDKNKKIYRFRIYNDYTGDMVVDANFIKNSLCDKNLPLDSNILKEINFFNFDKIGLIDNCELVLIKPAYGGIFILEDSK